MVTAAEESNVRLDDHVDDEIAECLNLDAPRSFFLFAGAGSGKTRSLVIALNRIRERFGNRLSIRGQRVAVITYTNAACDEINRRLAFDSLFHISTIHSFAWQLINGFTIDIRSWLRTAIAQDILDLRDAEAKGRAGSKASVTRQTQIISKEERLSGLSEIKTFTYNPDGDNKETNSLNHSEVISICAGFLSEKPLMRRILVNQYPILLIDESQDTNNHLIDAILLAEAAHAGSFALGLLGDTMQRIYNDGKDKLEQSLPESWAKPAKKLNHRCPQRVVKLISRIRRDVDRYEQAPRSDSAEGTVRLFVFRADTLDKISLEDNVRARMAHEANDDAWLDREKCKILTLEHHMAAKRMGFDNLFDALSNVDSLRSGLLDGSLPATHFFTSSILPLVTAHNKKDKFAIAKIIRELSPLLSLSRLKTTDQPRNQLRIASEAVENLMSLWDKHEPTCGAILERVVASDLFIIPDSLLPLLKLRGIEDIPTAATDDSETEAPDRVSEEIAALNTFLDVPFAEVLPYAKYVSDEAPFGTHQGVKGLEFDRVMVLMDDAEAKGFMFGYEKLFGAQERSATDINNERDGKETGLDRTRRLLYVTCSRAKRSLALVVYTANPEAVQSTLVDNGWFSTDEIVLHL